MDTAVLRRVDRARLAWWGVVAVLGVAVALFVASFVGTVVLGLFIYYGVRPLHRRLERWIDRRGVAASLTVLFVVLPVVALIGYAGLVAGREFAAVAGPTVTDAVLGRLPGDPQSIGVALQSPGELLGGFGRGSELGSLLSTGLDALAAAGNGLLHLTLALSITFFLLRDGPTLVAWFHDDIAEENGVSDAYLRAVDADLETVYFGNVLTVLSVGVAAVVVYNGFNAVAPPPLRLPFPTLLALLTGVATFVPLVVGKLVYLPATGYLAWTAVRTDAGTGVAAWVGGFLVVCFVVLDLVPQTFVRPYISGQSLHSGLVLFAYVLGAALFGWYGLFLGPLVLVLVAQAANVVLPELLHGERLTTETHTEIGSEVPVDDGSGDQEAADGTGDTETSAGAGGTGGSDGTDGDSHSHTATDGG
jgi:predicted PurR-regulated permease PerM